MAEGRDWVKHGIAGGILAFAVVSAAFMQGWLVPLDVAADRTLREPFGEWSDPGGTYHYVVLPPEPVDNSTVGSTDNSTEAKATLTFGRGRDADMYGVDGTGNQTCVRADMQRPARYDYVSPARTMRCDGNFTLSVQPSGYWVDPGWGGYASYFGSESAAFALITATCLLLAALGSWRTAIVALAVGALGGSLVDPMKDYFAAYGAQHYGALDHLPDRYPSGHTIGATLQFGLFLLLGATALQRTGLGRNPRLLRHAAVAWAVVAVACGLDRVVTHTHILSDVLAGWAFGIAFVSAAVWIDRRWHASLAARHAAASPEAAV